MKEETKDLILEATNGNQIAYTKLHKKYYKSIWVTIYKIVKNRADTDDIASISFTKAFMNMDKFYKLISFEMWLKTIALNTALDFIKRQRDYDLSLDDENIHMEIQSHQANPEGLMMRLELSGDILNVLDGLPQRMRSIITLRHIDELSYKEIAETLGISIGSVKSELHRAKQAFKKLYYKTKQHVNSINHPNNSSNATVVRSNRNVA